MTGNSVFISSLMLEFNRSLQLCASLRLDQVNPATNRPTFTAFTILILTFYNKSKS